MQIAVTGDSRIRLYRHYPRTDDDGVIDRSLYYLQWMEDIDSETVYWVCARVSVVSYAPRAGAYRVRTYSGIHMFGVNRTNIFEDKSDADKCANRCAAYVYRLIAEDPLWSITCNRGWPNRVADVGRCCHSALELVLCR